jgi:hypothetical protein
MAFSDDKLTSSSDKFTDAMDDLCDLVNDFKYALEQLRPHPINPSLETNQRLAKQLHPLISLAKKIRYNFTQLPPASHLDAAQLGRRNTLAKKWRWLKRHHERKFPRIPDPDPEAVSVAGVRFRCGSEAFGSNPNPNPTYGSVRVGFAP